MQRGAAFEVEHREGMAIGVVAARRMARLPSFGMMKDSEERFTWRPCTEGRS